MSPKALADILGVQSTGISRYERGARQFSVDKAKEKLAITSYKVKRKWYWSLPRDGCAPDRGEAGDGWQD